MARTRASIRPGGRTRPDKTLRTTAGLRAFYFDRPGSPILFVPPAGLREDFADLVNAGFGIIPED